MNSRYIAAMYAVCLWVLVPWAQYSLAAPERDFARVEFSQSCRPDVKSDFDHAITLLHSFEYPETTRIFNNIIEADPNCAMAYWGAAMSIWHPLWAPPGSAGLDRGAALLATATSKPSTAREKAYIDALAEFYADADPGKHRRRTKAYELAMRDVYMDHLSDTEAATFYALALLASADPKDKSYKNQFKAAGILNWVREQKTDHPGVLHYLIHSYDFPGLAHLALNVAKTYAGAAPDSAHAQHMPSHIFTRLGYWELALSSNVDSTRSAEAYTERAHLPGHYDEGLHSMDYLMYALLQTARDEDARQLLDKLAAINRTDTENFKVAYTYASSPARYALERRQWAEAADLQLIRKNNFPWKDFGFAQSIHHFARGIGAARSGQLEKAKIELLNIERLEKALPTATLTYWREQVRVHIAAVSAWIELSANNAESALRYARAAAIREDAVDKHPVTPGEVLPARELYADMLLKTGDSQEALAQYRKVLEGSPNRLNALLGVSAAASVMGDEQTASAYRTLAHNQARNGNGDRYKAL